MVEHASRPEEKRRLQELCSKQGAASYTRLLREPGVSLMDVLTAFPSCTPPVERLLGRPQSLYMYYTMRFLGVLGAADGKLFVLDTLKTDLSIR